jgi:hypothetical protein
MTPCGCNKQGERSEWAPNDLPVTLRAHPSLVEHLRDAEYRGLSFGVAYDEKGPKRATPCAPERSAVRFRRKGPRRIRVGPL